jgi:molecular chaperone HscA
MTRPQDGFVLGVDLGTSHTVAMLRRPDGRTRPLLFDGQPLLPSAVFLDAAGRLHVGRDALRLGHAEPGRLEPHPKRHIDAETVLLDTTDVPVADLLAALLGAVAREAVATAGFLPPAVVTHPAAWGARRRAVLTDALARAGWPAATSTLPEPVAAARYFADVLRRPVPVGAALAVFDFGGGTLDVAVVRNTGDGFTVAASGGADDLGGLDLDAALVDHLGTSLEAEEPEAWRALTDPVTLAQWRARRQFWDDVRGAKEMLSRTPQAPVAVPGVEHAVHVTRDEFEAAADPLIRRGVAEAATVLKAAGLTPGELAGLFLVGGSSRVPMVARLLHAELGIAPTVLDQPELPVAEGAVIAVSGTGDAPGMAPAGAASGAPGMAPAGAAPGASRTVPADAASDAPQITPTAIDADPAAGDREPSYRLGLAEAATPTPTADTAPGGQDAAIGTDVLEPTHQASSAPAGTARNGLNSGDAPDDRPGPPPAGGPPPGGGPALAGGPAPAGGPPSAGDPAPAADTHGTEPEYADPVDPWATGEAAAIAAAGGAPVIPVADAPLGHPGSPAAAPHSGAPHSATPHSAAPYSGAPHSAAPYSGAPHFAAPHPGPPHTGRPSFAPPQGGGHQPWLASAEAEAEAAQHDARQSNARRPDARTPGAGRPGAHPAAGARSPAYRKRLFWLVAAAVVVVLGLTTTLAVIFWPGNRALDYRPFATAAPTRLAPAVPIGSGFADSAVIGDRVYFANTDENGTLGVVAADAESGERLWASTAAGTAPRWENMVALPQGLAVFTDSDSTTRKRRMVILGAGRGDLLWERLIGDDDGVLFVADVAVLVDRVEKRLLFLELGDKGRVRGEQRSPTTDVGSATTVVVATTPADLDGPASTSGVAAAPDRDDDTRIVQIGADRSARVLDASTGKVVVPARQSVADPDDEVIAHNGRLIVRESAGTHRIMAYDLGELGEPRTLYTAPADVRLSELTPCGDDRVCWVETIGYDARTSRVASVNAAEGGGRWQRAVPDTEGLVPVGESVLARQNGSPPSVTLLDPDGTVGWTHRGVAARLNGGNLLLFSKRPTTSPDDPSVAGRHLGDDVREMGLLAGVRSETCSWNTAVIACLAAEDLVIQRFTG